MTICILAGVANLDEIIASVGRKIPLTDVFKGAVVFNEYLRVIGSEVLSSTRNLVELGVYDGASMLAWAALCPDASILGVDLKIPERLPGLIAENGLSDRITLLECDHADIDRIRSAIREPVDLFVDDGSHRLHPTLECFFGLFDTVRRGGYYCIEDWSNGYREIYGGPHGGVHRVLYAILDEIAWWDRMDPRAGRYELATREFLRIAEFRTNGGVAFVQHG